MNRLIQVLHVRGRESAHRNAIDSVIDFPVDFSLLWLLVDALAADLRQVMDPRRPVAVQLENGLAQVLLELALLRADIPHLALPTSFSASQSATAMAWSGAQAAYLRTTTKTPLNRALPISPPPDGTACVAFATGPAGRLRQILYPASALIATAEDLMLAAEPREFDRHLALLPPYRLTERVAGLYATMLAGGAYVIPPAERIGLAFPRRPDFARLVDTIDELRITSLVLDTALLAGIVSALEQRRCTLSLLERVAIEHNAPQALVEHGRMLGLPITRLGDLVPASAPAGAAVF